MTSAEKKTLTHSPTGLPRFATARNSDWMSDSASSTVTTMRATQRPSQMPNDRDSTKPTTA